MECGTSPINQLFGNAINTELFENVGSFAVPRMMFVSAVSCGNLNYVSDESILAWIADRKMYPSPMSQFTLGDVKQALKHIPV